MNFGRIRLGEWRPRVEKTAKSTVLRGYSRRAVESNLNDRAYQEESRESGGNQGLWEALAVGYHAFAQKSRFGVQTIVTLFLLPPDGVC
jgi:hypothetical protein